MCSQVLCYYLTELVIRWQHTFLFQIHLNFLDKQGIYIKFRVTVTHESKVLQ